MTMNIEMGGAACPAAIRPAPQWYEHPQTRDARDARLVDLFLHASARLAVAEAAAQIGVRPTTIHRWRSTGAERLGPETRAGILAYLARWSTRSESALDAT